MQAGNGISDLNQGVDTRRTLTRARFEAPAVAGAVMSGAPGRRNLSHAPGAGSRSTEFALKRADPFCNGRSQGKMNLSIIFACGAVGTHQGVLVSGIFLVEIHVRSPLGARQCCGLIPGFLVRRPLPRSGTAGRWPKAWRRKAYAVSWGRGPTKKKCPRTGVSRRRAMQCEMEEVAVRAAIQFRRIRRWAISI